MANNEPANSGNTDLLEMEVGLAVRDDEFSEAEQKLESFQQKLKDMSGSSTFELKLPSLDTFIKTVEKLIAAIDALNKFGLDYSIEHMGGLRYGLSTRQYSNIMALDRNAVAQAFDFTSGDVLAGISNLEQMASIATQTEGKLTSDTKFIAIEKLARELGRTDMMDANLVRLFADPNANQYKNFMQIAGLVRQGLQNAENNPEMAALAENVANEFFSQGFINLLDVNARMNLEKGTDVDFASYMLESVGYSDQNRDLQVKVLTNLIQQANNWAQIGDYFGGIATDVASATTQLTKGVSSFATNILGTEFTNAMPIDYETASYFEDIGGQKGLGVRTVRSSLGLSRDAYNLLKARQLAEMGYSEDGMYLRTDPTVNRERQFKQAQSQAIERWYKDADRANDIFGEAEIFNAYMRANMNTERARDMNLSYRMSAYAKLRQAGKSEDEINTLLSGKVGGEYFDVLRATGTISSDEYVRALQVMLDQFDVGGFLPEKYRRTAQDIQVTTKLEFTSEKVEIPVEIQLTDENGNIFSKVVNAVVHTKEVKDRSLENANY